MIKNSGLGQLAESAKEHLDPAGANYPVRRRGERRELRPNWTAIAWLEAQTLTETELLPGRPYYPDGPAHDAAWHQRTAARISMEYPAPHPTNCIRPMIELVDDYAEREDLMRGPQHNARPCPRCDDWSRTADCLQHYEQGVDAITSAGMMGAAELRRAQAAARDPRFAVDHDGVLRADQDPDRVEGDFRSFMARMHVEAGAAFLDHDTVRRISGL